MVPLIQEKVARLTATLLEVVEKTRQRWQDKIKERDPLPVKIKEIPQERTYEERTRK